MHIYVFDDSEQNAEFKAKIKPCSHQPNCMKFWSIERFATPVWRRFHAIYAGLAPKWHSVLGPVSYQFRAGFTPVSRRFHAGCYTRKKTLTNGDISWRCSKRRCKRVLRTAADLEVKSTFPEKEHTCPALTADEVFKMVGDDILVNSRYRSTTLQLARDYNHPDSRSLYKRRWRKSRASSGGSF